MAAFPNRVTFGRFSTWDLAFLTGLLLERVSLALRTLESAVARSPDLATGLTEGLPERGAGVRETCGRAHGGVGRPAPSAPRAQHNGKALASRLGSARSALLLAI